jgi:hypothetical protein
VTGSSPKKRPSQADTCDGRGATAMVRGDDESLRTALPGSVSIATASARSKGFGCRARRSGSARVARNAVAIAPAPAPPSFITCGARWRESSFGARARSAPVSRACGAVERLVPLGPVGGWGRAPSGDEGRSPDHPSRPAPAASYRCERALPLGNRYPLPCCCSSVCRRADVRAATSRARSRDRDVAAVSAAAAARWGRCR